MSSFLRNLFLIHFQIEKKKSREKREKEIERLKVYLEKESNEVERRKKDAALRIQKFFKKVLQKNKKLTEMRKMNQNPEEKIRNGTTVTNNNIGDKNNDNKCNKIKIEDENLEDNNKNDIGNNDEENRKINNGQAHPHQHNNHLHSSCHDNHNITHSDNINNSNNNDNYDIGNNIFTFKPTPNPQIKQSSSSSSSPPLSSSSSSSSSSSHNLKIINAGESKVGSNFEDKKSLLGGYKNRKQYKYGDNTELNEKIEIQKNLAEKSKNNKRLESVVRSRNFADKNSDEFDENRTNEDDEDNNHNGENNNHKNNNIGNNKNNYNKNNKKKDKKVEQEGIVNNNIEIEYNGNGEINTNNNNNNNNYIINDINNNNNNNKNNNNDRKMGKKDDNDNCPPKTLALRTEAIASLLRRRMASRMERLVRRNQEVLEELRKKIYERKQKIMKMKIKKEKVVDKSSGSGLGLEGVVPSLQELREKLAAAITSFVLVLFCSCLIIKIIFKI